ncbi:MAG: GIY-YIG nuclease family protein [Verrucomicrobiota bacterium]|jgi:hypothetical protein
MNKSHILQEINRVAEANGGAPPGEKTFQKETGIKKADWFGKIWARWSDALREAGLVPNEPQRAYSKTDLLDRYANFAQELGRLPALGDMRLKARTDSEFPADATFDNHFGTKIDLVNKLLEHCQSNTKYKNIVPLCEEYIAKNQNPSDKTQIQEEGQIGFVYLIKSGHFYKIGRANSAGRREYELAIQLPEKAKTIHVIRTDDPSGIEAYWHNRFSAKRKNGEWFELSVADVAVFKRRKFM